MPNNEIEFLGYYGGDETHALSAWTSTSRDLDIMDNNGKTKRDRLPAMLKMLAENGHETPFEKSTLHFLVTSEVASHIHALKHRIGVSINAESARYKELKDDKYYLPTDWPEMERQMLREHCERGLELYHTTLERLVAGGMSRKRAKESARFFLPYASQLTWDVTFNFRSFVAFQRLRNSEHAQMEIREIAKAMLKHVAAIPGNPFGASLTAFGLV